MACVPHSSLSVQACPHTFPSHPLKASLQPPVNYSISPSYIIV
jgi:hypothetical protein